MVGGTQVRVDKYRARFKTETGGQNVVQQSEFWSGIYPALGPKNGAW